MRYGMTEYIHIKVYIQTKKRGDYMKRSNMIIIVVIVAFFLGVNYGYQKYQDRRGEQYIPHRFKTTELDSPTVTPSGLVYLDGYLWISSTKDGAILKYDTASQTVIDSIEVPCFEVAGIAFDGENFWVADFGRGQLYEITMEGEVVSQYDTPYSTPYGVAYDGENIWVLDVYGIEQAPEMTGGSKTYPNSKVYKFDIETGTATNIIDAPIDHGGDINYTEGTIVVAGERKVFFIDPRTRRITEWYYSPDNLTRGIAIKDDTTHYVSGMDVRAIWEIDLSERMKLKEFEEQSRPPVPFWLVVICVAFLFPVILDEFQSRGKKE
jgi:hypothetical protein